MMKKLSFFSGPPGQRILLLLVVLVCYINGTGNGYNLDDDLVTRHHPLTSKGLSAVPEIFSSSYYSNKADISFGYRPLTLVSFAIEHQLFGEHAQVSHGISVLLFAAAVLLLYALVSSWTAGNAYPLAFCTALIFAVHPVHTEAVSSIKNRDELLAFVLMTASLLQLQKYLGNKRIREWLLASLFCALAILAKKSVYPMLVVWMPVAVFLNRYSLRVNAIALLALAVPAALIGSGLEWKRFLLMTFAPFMFLLLCYLAAERSRLQALAKKMADTPLPYVSGILLSAGIVLLAWQTQQPVCLLAAVPFVLLALREDKEWNVWALVWLCSVCGLVFHKSSLAALSLAVAAGYLSHQHTKGKALIPHTLAALPVLLIFIFLSGLHIGTVSTMLIIGAFVMLLRKNTMWAFAYSLVIVAVSLGFFRLHSYMAGMCAVAACSVLKRKVSWRASATLVTACVFGGIVYVGIQTGSFGQVYRNMLPASGAIVRETGAQVPEQVTFQEGRTLHYVENSLVTVHDFPEKVATGLLVLGEYTRLMLFPRELSFYYGYARVKTGHWNDSLVWTSLTLYLMLAVLALWLLGRRPLFAAGIIWYLACILLFSNWVELVAGMVGERLGFAASAGFCLFAAAAIFWWKPRFNLAKPAFAEYVFLAVLACAGARTFARNADWKDPLTLMRHDITHLDESAYAHYMLASNLVYESDAGREEAGRMRQEAISHYKRSIAVYPGFFNAHFDLARVYLADGHFAEAKQSLLEAYRLDTANLFVLEELAKTSFDLEDADDTEKYANAFLAAEPRNENVHEILAYIMLVNHRKARAKTYAERGLLYFPGNRNLQMIVRDASK